MTRLLEDLFDVSRITRGSVELRKKAVDLNTVVEHAVEAALPLLEALRHNLSKSLPSAPIEVEGDPTRLEQIVTNLLNNAAKYTEPGGKIAVTLAREADQAVLRIEDSGIGITPEMQRNIFDLFVQADRSLDRGAGGWGLDSRWCEVSWSCTAERSRFIVPARAQVVNSRSGFRPSLIERRQQRRRARRLRAARLARFGSLSLTITVTPRGPWREFWSSKGTRYAVSMTASP